jgi:hypothetical protein
MTERFEDWFERISKLSPTREFHCVICKTRLLAKQTCFDEKARPFCNDHIGLLPGKENR